MIRRVLSIRPLLSGLHLLVKRGRVIGISPTTRPIAVPFSLGVRCIKSPNVTINVGFGYRGSTKKKTTILGHHGMFGTIGLNSSSMDQQQEAMAGDCSFPCYKNDKTSLLDDQRVSFHEPVSISREPKRRRREKKCYSGWSETSCDRCLCGRHKKKEEELPSGVWLHWVLIATVLLTQHTRTTSLVLFLFLCAGWLVSVPQRQTTGKP